MTIFGNFGKILGKIFQCRSKNIYENVYSDEIRNCFPKEYARKSIFMDKFVENFDICLHFGDITTKKYLQTKYIK